MPGDLRRRIYKIADRDGRYKADAYEFVMEALRFTQTSLGRKGHVSGRELLDGIKNYGLKQYGPMLKTVLEYWGVRNTEAFGDIVFNMIDEGVLGKENDDSPEDFKNIYDFDSAFDVFKVTRR